jgi:hypothetical protein
VNARASWLLMMPRRRPAWVRACRCGSAFGPGVLAERILAELVDQVLIDPWRVQRRRLLPAPAMVWFVLALTLFRGSGVTAVWWELTHSQADDAPTLSTPGVVPGPPPGSGTARLSALSASTTRSGQSAPARAPEPRPPSPPAGRMRGRRRRRVRAHRRGRVVLGASAAVAQGHELCTAAAGGQDQGLNVTGGSGYAGWSGRPSSGVGRGGRDRVAGMGGWRLDRPGPQSAGRVRSSPA